MIRIVKQIFVRSLDTEGEWPVSYTHLKVVTVGELIYIHCRLWNRHCLMNAFCDKFKPHKP